MASLTGNKIKDSYLGLLKSIDNVDFAPRPAGSFVQISDGEGNGLPLYLSTAGIRFHNAYTFPSATGTVGQVLSANAQGDLAFIDNNTETLEDILTNGNTATLAILSTASGNTFGSTTFSGVATLANASIVSGTPPTEGDNSTNIATTAYVDNQVLNGATVKKTGTIAQNAIAVWNDAVDTLRSDSSVTILSDGTITLYQPNNVPTDKNNYNIGGGNIALNTGGYNTGFGEGNLSQVGFTTGSNNSAFGYKASFAITTGDDNTSVGFSALKAETTGNGNTSIGSYSMFNSNNVYYSTVIGSYALYSNTTGTQNIALGFESLYTNVSGDANTSLGYRALKANLGDRNIAVGYNSGISMTTGDNNVILGSFSGVRTVAPSVLAYDISASNNNIVISDGAGNVFQSFDSTGKARFHNYGGGNFTGTLIKTLGVDSIGNVIEVDTVTVSGTPVANQIAIWTNANTIKGDATLLIDANHKITLSQPNSAAFSTVSYNIGGGNIANVTGLNNTGFGLDNLSSLTTGTQNVAIGKSALGDNTEGLSNVSVGYLSLTSNTTGGSNIAIGVQSLQANTYASNNVSIGQSALILNVSGANNTAIGYLSLGANTANSNSTAVGYLSLRNSTGANNTAIGKDSGSAITTGSNNVIIGSNTGSTIATSDNNIIISDGSGNVRQSFDSNGAATFSGKITADAGIDIDNFNIDGTTIALSSGDLTLDSAADIVFDAAGDNWLFKKSGTTLLDIQKDQSNIEFINLLQDGDIKFRGVDGSANITALTLDMSDGGAAIFTPSGGSVVVGSNGFITSTQLLDSATAGGRFIGSSSRGVLGDIRIEQTTTGADGGYIRFMTSPNGLTSPTEKMRISSGGTINLNVMSTIDVEGYVKMGRSDGNISRFNQIKNKVSSTQASNFIKLSVHNGTENSTTDALTILGNGNVGIGVTPTAKLHIQGISSSSGGILIKNSGGNPYGIYSDNNDLLFTNGDGTTTALTISYTGLATFQSSVQEKIKLIASSSEYVSLAFANNSGTTQWEISKGNSNELYFYRGGGGSDQGTKLTISSDGDATFSGIIKSIGANTSTNIATSQTHGIHLQNTEDIDGNFIPIDFYNSTGFVTGRIGAEFQDAGVRNTDLFFSTRANGGGLTERMRITSGGNVGIGTDLPSAGAVGGKVLHLVNSGATASMRVERSGASIAGTLSITSGNTSNGLYSTGAKPLVLYTNSTERLTISSGGTINLKVMSTADAEGYVKMGRFDGNTSRYNQIKNKVSGTQASNFMKLSVHNGTENSTTDALTLLGNGNVGIGTTSPSAKLQVQGSISTATGAAVFEVYTNPSSGTDAQMASNAGGANIHMDANNHSSNTSPNGIIWKTKYANNAAYTKTSAEIKFQPEGNYFRGGLGFYTNNTSNRTTNAIQRMRILANGNVLIGGTADGGYKLNVAGGEARFQAGARVTGNFQVSGTVNVSGTKNFYIDHPLESKKDTHSLIHSSVESPEVNNLYRGKVDLVNGTATVNLDTVSSMTEGTFVALNNNAQCFTTNETNWDAVKGSVADNQLTIACQNSSSTANVSWMVIANRKDDSIMEAAGTDSNGNLIVEEIKTLED